MRVKDLAKEIRIGGYGVLECAQELEHISREAWHPVSEPPTEEDTDGEGDVMVYRDDGRVFSTDWRFVSMEPPPDTFVCWARIRDVVLLPPE